MFVCCIQQLAHTVAVQSRNAVRLTQTKVIKLVKLRFGRTRLVTFVDRQHDRLARAQQHRGNILVSRSNARAQVGDENDHVRVRDRGLRLKAHELQDLIVVIRLDAAGINDGKVAAAPVALRVQAVARYAGRVLHNGQALARQSVEQLAFADVRPSYDGHNRFWHIVFPPFVVGGQSSKIFASRSAPSISTGTSGTPMASDTCCGV